MLSSRSGTPSGSSEFVGSSLASLLASKVVPVVPSLLSESKLVVGPVPAVTSATAQSVKPLNLKQPIKAFEIGFDSGKRARDSSGVAAVSSSKRVRPLGPPTTWFTKSVDSMDESISESRADVDMWSSVLERSELKARMLPVSGDSKREDIGSRSAMALASVIESAVVALPLLVPVLVQTASLDERLQRFGFESAMMDFDDTSPDHRADSDFRVLERIDRYSIAAQGALSIALDDVTLVLAATASKRNIIPTTLANVLVTVAPVAQPKVDQLARLRPMLELAVHSSDRNGDLKALSLPIPVPDE